MTASEAATAVVKHSTTAKTHRTITIFCPGDFIFDPPSRYIGSCSLPPRTTCWYELVWTYPGLERELQSHLQLPRTGARADDLADRGIARPGRVQEQGPVHVCEVRVIQNVERLCTELKI